MRAVNAQDFDFELPPDLIAQQPLPERSASRLLVVHPEGHLVPGWVDSQIRDLPTWVQPGDLLVFNDTRVIPARLQGRKPSGGAVEMLLERALEGDRALLHMRASKPLRPGQVVETAGGQIVVEGRQDDLFRVRLPAPALGFFSAHGTTPLPPYITRQADRGDADRYQSVLAKVPGAVAAPTASLHFDEPLLAALDERGVQRTTLTLHVGAGTFQPLRSDAVDEHVMHAEWAEVPAQTVARITATRARGGRVIAVGTTVVRALEAAAQASGVTEPAAHAASGGALHALQAWRGDTRIFIKPGHRWQIVDGLVTNFHLPRSTLLMLVAAFVGRERILAAYQHAVQARYRFFSYGDAMLLTARRPE